MEAIKWWCRAYVQLWRLGYYENPFGIFYHLYWHYRWKYLPPKPRGDGGE